MKKAPMFIFIDDVLREYKKFYGDKWEKILLYDLNIYFVEFVKTSRIDLITSQNPKKIKDWLLKNQLGIFVESVENPSIKFDF